MIREPWGAARSVAVALLIGILASCTPTAHHLEDGGAGHPAAQPASGKQALADEAASVVRQYWRARNLAYSQLELGPLTGFEDQAADVLSRADIAYRSANGIPPDPSSTSSIREMHNYLTRPDRYPRWLLAAPEVYLLAFSRAGPDASWKLSWQAEYADNTRLPAIRVDADGFATSLTPAQQRATLLADATAVRRRLQDYRLQAAVASTPPRSSWVADTKDTYGAAKELQADARHSRLLGVAQRLTPVELDLPGFAVATRDGALYIVAIGEKTVRDQRSSPLQQDQNRISYDQRIPPGSYRTVVFLSLTTFAVEVPKAGEHRRATVVGSSSKVTSVTAKP